MALTFNTTIAGQQTQEDKRAGLYAIQEENKRRAALTPPGTPLPSGNPAQISASLKEIMDGVLKEIHSHNIARANIEEHNAIGVPFHKASDEVRAQVKALLGQS